MVYTMQYNGKYLKYPPIPLFRSHFPSLARFPLSHLIFLCHEWVYLYIIHLPPLIIYRTNCLNRKQSTTHQYCHAIIVLSEKKASIPFSILQMYTTNSRNWKKIKKKCWYFSLLFSLPLAQKQSPFHVFYLLDLSSFVFTFFRIYLSVFFFPFTSLCVTLFLFSKPSSTHTENNNVVLSWSYSLLFWLVCGSDQRNVKKKTNNWYESIKKNPDHCVYCNEWDSQCCHVERRVRLLRRRMFPFSEFSIQAFIISR